MTSLDFPRPIDALNRAGTKLRRDKARTADTILPERPNEFLNMPFHPDTVLRRQDCLEKYRQGLPRSAPLACLSYILLAEP